MPEEQQGIVFQIEVEGEEQISRYLEGVTARARDLTPLWEDIADDFHRVELHQFDSEGAYGPGWPALSPAYAEWKEQHYPGAPLLVQTGALKESLVSHGPGSIEERSADALTIGTSIHYAAFHQTGTSRMPPRPPIVIPEEAKARWTKKIHAFLLGAEGPFEGDDPF